MQNDYLEEGFLQHSLLPAYSVVLGGSCTSVQPNVSDPIL